MKEVNHMDENELFKQVQKAVENPPLILVGSGGSAPYGLPSMWELGNHLKATLDPRYSGDYSWKCFIENLDDRQDLETALSKITLSEEIIDDIKTETWKLISDKDFKLFDEVVFTKKELSIGRLIKKFYQTSSKCVNVLTTNYDRVIEYACDSAGLPIYNGYCGLYTKHFNHDFQKRNAVNIVKVHGSLDTFRDVHGETIGIPMLRELRPGLTPEIITPGLSKYQYVLKGTIREMLHEADQLIDVANSFLCIGYGFNDEHIQEKIITKINQGTPIVVITMKLSDKAAHLINEKSNHSIIIEKGEAPDSSTFIVNGRITELAGTFWTIDGFMSIID